VNTAALCVVIRSEVNEFEIEMSTNNKRISIGKSHVLLLCWFLTAALMLLMAVELLVRVEENGH
jgi:hypothetical protein